MKKMIFILIGMTIGWACDDKTDLVIGPETVVSEFTDQRDGKVYKCVTIDGQTWMAENLAYRLPLGSLDGCYTYNEGDVDTNGVQPKDEDFYREVEKALKDKKFSEDPLPESPFFTPASMVEMYMGYGAPVKDFMDMMEGSLAFYPSMQATIDFLVEILNALKNDAINEVVQIEMEKAERFNGDYKKNNGLLYTYEAALKALPKGWRLPTDDDWKKLEETLGVNEHELNLLEEWRGESAGVLLRDSKTNFNVVYAGARVYGIFNYDSPYMNKGMNAYYWSASNIMQNDSTKLAIIRTVSRVNDGILRGTSNMTAAYSVRAIKE